MSPNAERADTWPTATGPGWELVQADALRWLPTLPAGSVDCIVTDTPYSSGGAYRGDRVSGGASKYVKPSSKGYLDFEGESRDQRAQYLWLRDLCLELYRVARPGARIALCSDWRQYSITEAALQAAGFTWRGTLVWDKTAGARPQPGRPRQQTEYALVATLDDGEPATAPVLWGSRGPWPIERGTPPLPGMVTAMPTARHKNHPTAKPLPLTDTLVELCPPGGTVLDCCVGGGAVLVSAARSGRRALGCEMTPHYWETAADWLREVAR